MTARPGLVLLVAVLAPTACLLWFMQAAMRNERLAVRQTLAEAYRASLAGLPARFEAYWQKAAAELELPGNGVSAPAWFARCVQAGLADGLVITDNQGRPAYPASPVAIPAVSAEAETEWAEATRFEWARREPAAAARLYGAIAAKTTNINLAARALQARTRCLVQAGEKDAAIQLVTEVLDQERYQQATDSQGRSIIANAELFVLELVKDPASSLFQTTAGKLRRRLLDYDPPTVAAPQRRFLMRQVESLSFGAVRFPTLAAEDLSARFLNSRPQPVARSVLCPTPLAGVWQVATPSGRLRALFHTETLIARLRREIPNRDYPATVSVSLISPATAGDASFVSLAAGPAMPGWRLTLSPRDPRFFDTATQQRVTRYLWMGILTVGTVYLLALFAAHTVRRQVALARLKTDLVTVISHELKTPLASVRVLVDSLLESESFAPRTTREYLELIARENDRLSRVVENFLTFSRMERGKYTFHFSPVPAAEIIDDAVEAFRPRLESPGCHFEVRQPPDLPMVDADLDSLATALLNLLDNAYKYSGDLKHIVLRASASDGKVLFEVEDNGIGVPARETGRIFRDFYQVDRQLSRKGSGCGLGLSIVRLIMKAHRGRVRVNSQPGQGSVFALELPALAEVNSRGKEVHT